MSETIIVTPEDVRAGGNELMAAKSAFETVMRTLSETIDTYGPETWGKDSYGREFADGERGYRSSRNNLLSGGRDMVRTVGEFGTGLLRAGNAAEAADFGNSHAF
ncbi:hypothetical protein DFR70_108276 [Nocardia tenerifensis]|uniref:WXG100 family type VII secretion target n=1 Tax=Nocardia tenerifensis TaxID=228006 RepID=A0A318JXL2_9NOCA|nr:hypothetical protein [Nocardia tenerifensis]PXX61718.1 hypothetical protein DFR70_108276 [Nocardia tenerifensis]